MPHIRPAPDAPAAEPRTLAGVPVLVAEPPAACPAPWPVVLWHHGFRADALAHAGELTRVAALGLLAVGVDAVGHGRRADPALAGRLAASAGGALPVMLDYARATAAETPALLDALAADPRVDVARAGIVGISQGGYVTYRALVVEPRLRAAVALLGSPEWPDPDTPHAHPEALRRVALLSITAERDASVPPDAARRLHAWLGGEGAGGAPSRYVELPDAPHLVSAAQWATAMDETMSWLARTLRG